MICEHEPLNGLVFFVAILFGLGKYAAFIPLSVLAGILITVGINIIDYKGLKYLRRIHRIDAVILVIVLLIMVFGNMLHAVLVGIILAYILFIKQIGDLSESATSIQELKGSKGEESIKTIKRLFYYSVTVFLLNKTSEKIEYTSRYLISIPFSCLKNSI